MCVKKVLPALDLNSAPVERHRKPEGKLGGDCIQVVAFFVHGRSLSFLE